MQWCKQRALEYLQPGPYFSPSDAIASMLSDLGKHEETRELLGSPIVALAMLSQDATSARRFIEGFA
jgi:predicted YcjX-like family ATPase